MYVMDKSLLIGVYLGGIHEKVMNMENSKDKHELIYK